MVALAATLSLLIGIVLGMLGGGGAILAVPMLVYAVGVEPKTAIAMSLFLVGTTSLVGAAVHARAGVVRWKVGAMFGISAMAAAFAGGRVASIIPATVLLVLFGMVMVGTAVAMLRGRRERESAPGSLRIPTVLILGAGVGFVSGLVGAGGGFLVVPALVLLGGIGMREAIGTSLLVITLQSFAGFTGHLAHANVDWTLLLVATAAAAAGSIVGASIGKAVSAERLRGGFAWLIIAIGLFIFAKQLPPWMAIAAAALTLLAALIARRRTRKAATALERHHRLPPSDRATPSQYPSPRSTSSQPL